MMIFFVIVLNFGELLFEFVTINFQRNVFIEVIKLIEEFHLNCNCRRENPCNLLG